jgi:hypothetical protein
MDVKITPLPESSGGAGDTYKRFDYDTTFPEGGLKQTDIYKRALEAERRVLGRLVVDERPGRTANVGEE